MAPPHWCSVLLHAITKGQNGIAAVELLVGHLPEMHGGRMVFIVPFPGKPIPVDRMGWRQGKGGYSACSYRYFVVSQACKVQPVSLHYGDGGCRREEICRDTAGI